MSIQNLYALYAVNVVAGANSVFIDQVTRQHYGITAARKLVRGGGSIFPGFVSLESQAFAIEIATTKVISTLAKVPVEGLAIATEGYLVELAFQARAQGGIFAATGHQLATISLGRIALRSLAIPKTGPALLALGIIPVWNGTDDPILLGSGLPAGAPLVSEVFGMGPVRLTAGGDPADVQGLEDVNLDFGNTETVQRSGDDLWPTFVAGNGGLPSVLLKSTEALNLYAYGLKGAPLTACEIWLRQAKDGETYYGDDEAKHCKIALVGRLDIEDLGADGEGDASSGLRITPVSASGAAILTITPDQIIPEL